MKRNISLVVNGTILALAAAAWLGFSQPTSAADGQFVNLSTRAVVGTGKEVMIGGFIIEEGARQVLIQAVGPELANAGISYALADPVLTVTRNTDGMELMVNDDWEDSQGQLVSDLWGGSPNLNPGSLSSAAVLTLDPGNYTAKVEGKDGTAEVAIIEVYGIDSPDTGSPDTDREALAALYNATDGSNWTNNTNWLSDAPLAQWFGVTVDDNSRVIQLSLFANRLSGPIPAELGSLTNLQELVLSSNGLTGSIPAELGSLGNLQTLYLNNNRLTGSIPQKLGSLSNLQWLALSGNRLTGSIPEALGSLSDLKSLVLYANPTLSGPLPSSFTALVSLKQLVLLDTQLCAPRDAAFQAWLAKIEDKQGVVKCDDN